MSDRSRRGRGGGAPRANVLVAALLFGTTGTAQALGPEGIAPAAVGAARVALGGLVLVLAAGATGVLVRAPRPRARGATALMALGIAAYQVCFFSGVARAGVAVGTVVAIGSAPAFTGLAGLLAGDGRPERGWATATALAVGGAALLVLPGAAGGTGGADPLGVGLALAAGAAYATSVVASKRMLSAGGGSLAVNAIAFGLAGLLLLPVLALAGAAWLTRPEGLALALYLALVPTALAYLLFGRGLARLPSPTVATLTLAEPLTAAALGVGLLGERPTALDGLGAALVLAGLVVLARPGRAETTPEGDGPPAFPGRVLHP